MYVCVGGGNSHAWRANSVYSQERDKLFSRGGVDTASDV